ncbi:hypothetical protein OSB04_009914 [Centaurea solstitialis]|uniref:Myeloid leukemia factor n=1 Tax=Centaurea solstitialis TaxID=347529 RepID=A0AA38T6I8_9ASTR|nr:hypothetical protein OSB04_009914 [Centaurea solstitialis]
MPSLFGGRDPFDDPFFTRPFGGIFPPGPAGSPFMGLNPFGSSLFGPSAASPFMVEQAPIINGSRPSLPNHSRGPIIEELNSDDEKEQHDDGEDKKENPRRHGRSEMQPYVEHPDDESEGRVRSRTQFGDGFGMMNNRRSLPQGHSFTFQSSTVTYGGANGAYYTNSTTRRTGSDGLRFEEYKEADSVTGQAAHRLLRGIHDKGHAVTRNLKSDGQVETMQVLHNINEDELAGFDETWKGKARNHLPGWTGGASTHHEGLGDTSRSRNRGGLALPSNESSPSSHIGMRRRADVDDEHVHAQSPSKQLRRR